MAVRAAMTRLMLVRLSSTVDWHAEWQQAARSFRSSHLTSGLMLEGLAMLQLPVLSAWIGSRHMLRIREKTA
jgi:hypothetical protein